MLQHAQQVAGVRAPGHVRRFVEAREELRRSGRLRDAVEALRKSRLRREGGGGGVPILRAVGRHTRTTERD